MLCYVIIANKFVVLEKVRHSQRINNALIHIWIITAKNGTVNCDFLAHGDLLLVNLYGHQG